jgi:beta-aspartyl-dipeptidase (metallo-type)
MPKADILLVKGGEVYSPNPLGVKDILISFEKIMFINEGIERDIFKGMGSNVKVVDAGGCIILPGIIDQHVHINGAGGEAGPQFRTTPVFLGELVKHGITSVIGVLGTDGITRSLRELLMKARGLENEGVSSWMYTGSYQVPSPTITGRIVSDILLIDKVIGVKLSLSDHRSSHPSVEELRRITSDARVAGMLSGKAGVVHIHMGTEDTGFNPVFQVLDGTEIPIEQFAPTHINRAEKVFEGAVEFGRKGGYVDVTSAVSPTSPSSVFEDAIKPSIAVKELIQKGVSVERITMSSDGHGSVPIFDEKRELIGKYMAPISSLYSELRDLIREDRVKVEDAVKIVSTNVAKHLKLVGKGEIKVGADADVLIIDKENMKLKHVIAKGDLMMENGNILRRSVYE